MKSDVYIKRVYIFILLNRKYEIFLASTDIKRMKRSNDVEKIRGLLFKMVIEYIYFNLFYKLSKLTRVTKNVYFCSI